MGLTKPSTETEQDHRVGSGPLGLENQRSAGFRYRPIAVIHQSGVISQERTWERYVGQAIPGLLRRRTLCLRVLRA